MRLSVILIYATLFATKSFAQNAPFGVAWGDSGTVLLSMNPSITEVKRNGNITVYKTTSMPEGWSDSESYNLYVHKIFGLQKIVTYSNQITNDIYGTRGINNYSQLKNVLNKKYGAPTREYEIIELTTKTGNDTFYECISDKKCGSYSALWLPKAGMISIELNGISRGRGFISIVYDGPNWIKVIEESKNRKSEGDKSAL